jgi:ABC-type dipeptide/oligopeptide/nickel transport system ATPase component
MMNEVQLLLGYSYDRWYGYELKEPIYTDASLKCNSHLLCCGLSGSGKSYATLWILANLCKANEMKGKVYFADFKQEDSYVFLRKCPRYYPYDKTIEALEVVYDIMHKRQAGEDKERTQITLVWDEYMANILSLQAVNKKKADEIMKKMAEILMLGRSLGFRIFTSVQRADAVAFPTGSRINYGIIIVLGASLTSILEMLLPKEYIESIGDRVFGIGEGVMLLQGSQLHFVKIPLVRNEKQMQQICIDALTM